MIQKYIHVGFFCYVPLPAAGCWERHDVWRERLREIRASNLKWSVLNELIHFPLWFLLWNSMRDDNSWVPNTFLELFWSTSGSNSLFWICVLAVVKSKVVLVWHLCRMSVICSKIHPLSLFSIIQTTLILTCWFIWLDYGDAIVSNFKIQLNVTRKNVIFNIKWRKKWQLKYSTQILPPP